jgi:hypothetical protein
MSTLSDDLFLPEMEQSLIAVVQGERVSNNDTGEWENGTPQNINFTGVILPLTSRDLNQLQTTGSGQFSINDKKLYTTYSDTFKVETKINAGKDKNGNDIIYQVYVIKDYGIVSNLRRYYIKKIEKVDG